MPTIFGKKRKEKIEIKRLISPNEAGSEAATPPNEAGSEAPTSRPPLSPPVPDRARSMGTNLSNLFEPQRPLDSLPTPLRFNNHSGATIKDIYDNNVRLPRPHVPIPPPPPPLSSIPPPTLARSRSTDFNLSNLVEPQRPLDSLPTPLRFNNHSGSIIIEKNGTTFIKDQNEDYSGSGTIERLNWYQGFILVENQFDYLTKSQDPIPHKMVVDLSICSKMFASDKDIRY